MEKTVEKGAEQAVAQEEVEKAGDIASLSPKEIADLAEALKQSLEREAKVIVERDNYKEGMLKAKGKIKTDEGADEGEGEGEKAKTTDTSAELIGLVKTLINRNQELVTASVNRQQISTAGQGGSAETKIEPTDNLLSAAQVNDLKTRGWDDKKIARFKENLLKTRA